MMAEIASAIVSVTTTGADGSATGSGTTAEVLRGFLLAVHLDYHASAPNTTDVTVTDAATSTAICVYSNSATDAVIMPLKQNVDAAGAAISGVYSNYPLSGKVTISVAGANALTNCVVAKIIYMAV